jgi:hypothetical protein
VAETVSGEKLIFLKDIRSTHQNLCDTLKIKYLGVLGMYINTWVQNGCGSDPMPFAVLDAYENA